MNRRELARHALGIALRVYRRHPAKIATISAVVFAPLALIDTFGSTQAEYLLEYNDARAFIGVMVLLTTSLLTAGAAVGAGLMDGLVAREFGHRPMSMSEALGSLPKGRLLGVDLSVSLIVAFGTLLGAIPGLAAFTLLCLSGPLLVHNDLGVRAAMARSVDLTRHHLLVTFLIVTIPVVIEHQLLDALDILWDFPFLVLFAAHIVMAVVVLASVVLVEIALALTLAQQKETPDAHAQPVSL